MARNLVEALYRESTETAAFLKEAGQISFYSSADNSFRKTLLLAAASYFEAVLTETLLSFTESQLSSSHPLFKIVKTQGIDRRYHSWFAWERSDAKQFFTMFGDGFKKYMQERVDRDNNLKTSIGSFMEIGALRNLLVHGNFATFSVEKTPEEIYQTYLSAKEFVESFGDRLDSFMESLQTGTSVA